MKLVTLRSQDIKYIWELSNLLEIDVYFPSAPEWIRDALSVAAADGREEGHRIRWTLTRAQHHIDAIAAMQTLINQIHADLQTAARDSVLQTQTNKPREVRKFRRVH